VWGHGGRAARWLLFVLAVLPFAEVRNYPHVHDDHVIRGALSVAADPGVPLSDLLQADFFGSRDALTGQTGFWRPLVLLSFRVEALLAGASEAGYTWLGHVLTVLAHAWAAFALLRLLRAVGLPPAAALLGAAWFAVHPVHVESVAWASGRTDSLPTALGFTAMALALEDGERRAAPWLCGLLLGLALLCKEPAVLLVFLLPVLSLAAGRRPLRALAPSVGALAVVLTLRVTVFGLLPGADPSAFTGPEDPGVRWLTWLTIVPRLLRLLLWPGPATPIHLVDEAHDPLAVGVLAGVAVLLLLSAAAAVAWRRRTLPGLLAAGLVGGTVLMLAPWVTVPTGFPEVAAPLFERYLYAAAAAPAILLALVVGERARLAFAGVLALGLAMGPVTAQRARMWSSDTAFAQAGLAVAPEATSLWVHLGTARLEIFRATGDRGAGQEALAAFDRALLLQPDHRLALMNRLIARALLGQLQAADGDARMLLERFPADPAVLHNVAGFHAELGDLARAAALYERELATGAALPGAAEALAACREALGR
jgi:hypothetical protein